MLHATYDYLPADVSPEMRNAKIPALDGFFKFVEDDLATNLPLLREALSAEDANLYFLFDGSVLLCNNAESPEDFQIAVDATVRCRLKDLTEQGYLHHCLRLSGAGVDALPAILKMMEDPKFEVFIARHSLRLRQADCVSLCLIRMPEDLWVPKWIERLQREKDLRVARVLLRCLGDVATAEADAAVRAFRDDESNEGVLRMHAAMQVAGFETLPVPADVTTTRAQFLSFLSESLAAGRIPLPSTRSFRSEMNDGPAHVLPEDVPQLRQLRALTAGRITDEAIHEIRMLTQWIRQTYVK